MIYTTLNKIRENEPCLDGWRKLLAGLNKTGPDDELLPLVRILEINGLNDALWALHTTDCDRESRLLVVAYARQVQHLMKDGRSIACIDVAERFANGKATREELEEARAAARDAWSDATRAAAEAAWIVAARAAADAAWAAAFAAADAAWAAAGDAGAAATRAAAGSAARAAARDAADDAEDAARDNMLQKQIELFKEIFG